MRAGTLLRLGFWMMLLGLVAWVAMVEIPGRPAAPGSRDPAAAGPPDPAQDQADKLRGTDLLSQAEKQRLGYIRLSLMERRTAYQLSDTGRPFAQVIAADEDRELAMWQRTERAYDFARMATDGDLAVAHPDLPGQWRNLYQEGLRLRLWGYKEQGSMQQNIIAEFEGVELLNKFWSWWRRNRRDIKLPRERS